MVDIKLFSIKNDVNEEDVSLGGCTRHPKVIPLWI
jgi:hypothetical protein